MYSFVLSTKLIVLLPLNPIFFFSFLMQLDEFVLCKIYKRPGKSSATTRVAGDREKAKVDGEDRETSYNDCDLDIPHTQSSFYDECINMHKEDQPLQCSNLEYRQNFPNKEQKGFLIVTLFHDCISEQFT
uniref:Uncharacterized protein n=1 Tax=Nelumbo nucifera TaxID=4432 RepID=A0A822YNW8_NELNU|nr:TPA_asm: hypothetical protein HUJ06_004940 [Nelumbo nucifera]